MFSSAEHQLAYKVANAPVHVFPYPHIIVHDVFPRDYYSALRRHLPPNNAYKSLQSLGRVSDAYPNTRSVLPLTPNEIAALPHPCRDFWTETAAWLLGSRFANVVLKKFGPFLAQRFDNLAAMRFHHESLVIQDHTHYALGPHTDSPTKVLSFLFYLPEDDSMPHLGTSMYLPKDPAFTCPGGPHHPFERFERLLTVPYVPNTLFAFVKTLNAFHGVEPIAEPNVERALLLYDIKLKNAVPTSPST
jgi:hypothetical protein